MPTPVAQCRMEELPAYFGLHTVDIEVQRPVPLAFDETSIERSRTTPPPNSTLN